MARIAVLACVAGATLAAQDASAPVRAGAAGVSHPRLLNEVVPVYPPLARSARVSGTVVIEVVIEETGQVADATIARSNPLLDGSALEAVRQWRFEPPLVNGRIGRLATTITVRFMLLDAEAPAPPPDRPASPSGMPGDFAVVYDYGCKPGNRTGHVFSMLPTLRSIATAATHDLEPLYRQLLETGLLSRTEGLRVWQEPVGAAATVRADGATVTATATGWGFSCWDKAGSPLYGVAVRNGGTWRRLWPPLRPELVPPEYERQMSAIRDTIQQVVAGK